MANKVFSLYRCYIRQVNKLPVSYLRQYFRIKAADDFRTILRTTDASLQSHKLKRASQDLRRLVSANQGNTKQFAHILDLAYGRKGKLKREIIQPILSDPKAPLPARIIPEVEKSRPPVYSQELTALLTCGHSRTTKALQTKHLEFPPTLPERANPLSEDARLLGRLSKRREVNIRWRYFTKEWRKVLPPLQVVVYDRGNKHTDVSRAGIRGLGLQGSGVFEEIEAVVGPVRNPRPLTRKERQQSPGETPGLTVSPRRHPSRWLRRRYQILLGRLPILTYTPSDDKKRGWYSVTLAPNALSPALQSSARRLSEMNDPGDQDWFRLAFNGGHGSLR